MSLSQEPAVEVLCHKCNGLGRLRTRFSSDERWIKCAYCGGTGILRRNGCGALPDLSVLKREEKNFGQCGVESRHAYQTEASGRQATVERSEKGMVKNVPFEPSTKPGENQVGIASDHCPIPFTERCNLCEQRALMIYQGGKYCAVHGKEKLMEDK